VKRYAVKLRDRAVRQYAIAGAWWRTYRLAAPNALRDEIRAACSLLSMNPEAGRIDGDQGGEVRRLLLPATRYLLYYRVDHQAREVQILTLWHASREATDL
jgi:plasmid stabilization system protein ParE